MARVVPRVVRQDISVDRFARVVLGFYKKPTVGMIEPRQARFRDSLDIWRKAHPTWSLGRHRGHRARPFQLSRLVTRLSESEAEEIAPRKRRLAVPEIDKTIFVQLRRAARARRTNPAMRMGLQKHSTPMASSTQYREEEAGVGEGYPQTKPEAVERLPSAKAR